MEGNDKIRAVLPVHGKGNEERCSYNMHTYTVAYRPSWKNVLRIQGISTLEDPRGSELPPVPYYSDKSDTTEGAGLRNPRRPKHRRLDTQMAPRTKYTVPAGNKGMRDL